MTPLIFLALFASVLGLPQKQNCVGSQCNQNNNFGGVGFAGGLPGFAGGFPGFAGGFPFGASFPFSQPTPVAPVSAGPGPVAGSTQNCQGSSCNQNNVGPLSGPAAPVPTGSVPAPGPGSTQNCGGSSCNQNNIG